MFIAYCFVSSNKVNKRWLISSGCTNYMTSNESIFKRVVEVAFQNSKLEMINSLRLKEKEMC